MLVARLLPERLRNAAPEALAFAVIGALNSVLYFVVFNATLLIGPVKATVIASVVTTTLSYLANRHWTYKDRPRSTLRREYALFLAFNVAGMLIQAAVVAGCKYGLGFDETMHRVALNVATGLGIGLATIFRFWAYRTMVFKSEPALAVVDIPAERVSTDAEFTELTAPLEAEFGAQRQPGGGPQIRNSLIPKSLVRD